VRQRIQVMEWRKDWVLHHARSRAEREAGRAQPCVAACFQPADKLRHRLVSFRVADTVRVAQPQLRDGDAMRAAPENPGARETLVDVVRHLGSAFGVTGVHGHQHGVRGAKEGIQESELAHRVPHGGPAGKKDGGHGVPAALQQGRDKPRPVRGEPPGDVQEHNGHGGVPAAVAVSRRPRPTK